MPVLRIGFFEKFKLNDSLLLEGDAESIQTLSTLLRTVASSKQPIQLDQCQGVVAYGGVRVTADFSSEDFGLVATSRRSFSWRRSAEGWADVVDKLASVCSSDHPCHQYLDGPSDDVQAIVSLEEYGEAWWADQAS